MKYELEARNDSRKSFYGKAQVITRKDGTAELWSYNTNVATLYPSGLIKVNGWYSDTTKRHIDEFLRQHGREPIPTNELKEAGVVYV